jgi:tripartite-type tricarboxylate transporter receptor subunit TctC
MSSRATLSCILAAAAVSVCLPVAAQAFPSKPLLIILPYTPGASADTTMRLINQKVSESVGQTVRIENRPGGGGVIGAMAVKQAAPDGYTCFRPTSARTPGTWR